MRIILVILSILFMSCYETIVTKNSGKTLEMIYGRGCTVHKIEKDKDSTNHFKIYYDCD